MTRTCTKCGRDCFETTETFEGQRSRFYECFEHGRVDIHGEPRR